MFPQSFFSRYFSLKNISYRVFQLSLFAILAFGYLLPQVYAAPFVSADATDFVSTSNTAARTTPNLFENLIDVATDVGNQIKDTVTGVIDKVTNMVTGISTPETINTTPSNPTVEIIEQDTDTGKSVTISSPDENPETPLINVLTSTIIPKIYKVGEENKIKIKWKNEGNQEMSPKASDTNSDGYLDLVEWTVPHLSTQTFEIIFISNAFRLDENKQITEDIYSTVSSQDNVWTTIQNNEWLRFTFEHPVDSGKNIDIYAKPTNEAEPAKIEVYRENSNELIATFNIDHEGYFHKSMVNLGGNPADVFDFKIIGGVEIDYVQDAGEDVTIGAVSDAFGSWSGGTFTCEIGEQNQISTTTLTTKLNASNVVIDCAGGPITINSAISWTTVGNSLTINGTATTLSANITGPGSITMNSAITLGAGVTVESTSEFSIVTFSNTIDGANSLTVNTTAPAEVYFNGVIGGTTAIQTLSVTASDRISLAASAITLASGYNATFTGPVTLDSNVVITTAGTSTVEFAGTIDGAYTLAVTGGTTATFGGIIGGGTPIRTLAVTAGTAINLNTTAITLASGYNATFTGPVNLGANLTITTAGTNTVNFTSTINGAFTLAVTGGTTATFGGIIGGTTAIKNLAVTASTAINLNTTSITVTPGSGGNGTTFTGPVNLGADLVVTISSTATVASANFTSTINGAYTLTVNNNGANRSNTFGGIIGGTTPIKTLTVSSTSGTGSTLNTTAINIASGYNVTFTGAVTLGANLTITTAGTNTVSITGAINGAKTLTINAGASGTATFGGIIGGTTPIQTLAVTAGTAINLNTTAITLASGYNATFTGPVNLGANLTITTAGTNTVNFTSTINGAFTLTVNAGTSGTVTFGGIIGGTTQIRTLAVTASTAININTTAITIAGGYSATFTGPVNLGANLTLTLNATNAATFTSTINGAYTFTTAGSPATKTLTFGGIIGGITPLRTFTIGQTYGGNINLNGGAITLAANYGATFNGLVVLGANTTINVSGTAHTVYFNGTINGAKTLAVAGGANTTVTFGSTIGVTTPIQTLAITAGTAINININTTAITLASGYNATFTGPVNLGANLTITTLGTNTVNFTSTINGAYNLTTTTGASGTVTISGAVGGSTPLSAINVTCSSGTFSGAINALSYTNSGGNVTMADNVVLTGGLTLSAGSLTAPTTGKSITLAGNWANSVGTSGFVPRLGTVIFNGASQSITGSTTFYDLTKSVASTSVLTFGASTTQTITHELTLNGATGQLLNLVSSVPGTVWNLNTTGATSLLDYLGVTDSNSTIGVSATNSVNNGNNTNWTFPFSCTIVTDVPVAECQALMSIYENTGGTGWANQTNWGASPYICDWYGVSCSGGDVNSLSLGWNNLSGSFAITAGSLDALQTLDLAFNQLTSFTGTGLSSLLGLNIAYNGLTSFDGTGMNSLQYLELFANQLTSFSGTSLSSLTELSLAGNLLTSFSSTNLSLLTTLQVGNNRISALTNMTNMTSMASLDLATNCLVESVIDPGIVTWLNSKTSTWRTLDSWCPESHFVTTWKTDNAGTSNSTSLTIPTHPGSTYSYQVDWNNDGDFIDSGETTLNTGSVTHNFGVAGTYTIRIKGTFPRIYFNHGGDRLKILRVNQWGNNPWTSMEYAFYGCANLNGVTSDVPNLANVTNMSYMFANATTFNQPIGLWNTSTVTNMDSMLQSTTAFNQPLTFNDNGTPGVIEDDKWNTTAVTNMKDMFIFATAFNQNIGSWNTGNVVRMDEMFRSATAFNNGGSDTIKNWNTSKVGMMDLMFHSASAFNQPIGTWNVAAVQLMDSMFKYASAFNQPLGTWNTSSVSTMGEMFKYATAFNQPIGSWNVRNVTDMSQMFEGVTLTTLNYDNLLNGWAALSGPVVKPNVTFHGGYSLYCTAGAARNTLDNAPNNWTLTDGGNLGVGCSHVSFCATVTDVPADECMALLSLYDNNGGTTWTYQDNWGTSTEVCSWYGVSCNGGNVNRLSLWGNNLSGDFAITPGNLNALQTLALYFNQLTSFDGTGMPSLQSINLDSNQLTSFDGTGMPSLFYLYLYNNQLTYFNGSSTPSLHELSLSYNQLSSFDGIGMSGLNYLYLDYNQLSSFDGTGMSSLQFLNLDHNQFTSFNGLGLRSLGALDVANNQLTSFNSSGMPLLGTLTIDSNKLTALDGTGLSQLTVLSASNNLIAALSPNMTALTNITSPYAALANNCLSASTLSPGATSWLGTYAMPDWTTRNVLCPAAPNTMYFWGTYPNFTYWNQQANWYQDALHTIPVTLKTKPDASDNAIILSDLSANSSTPAIVKTFEVRNNAIISVPISNGSGATLTTALDGNNNDITWTATDPAVTLTYANPAEQATTTVTVSGKNITVTPGTKAQVSVSGNLSGKYGNPVVFPPLYYADNQNDTLKWTHNAQYEFSYTGEIYELSSGPSFLGSSMGKYIDGQSMAGWYTASVNLPNVTWTPSGFAVGTPTIMFAPSSASQVIAAVAVNPIAAVLLSGTLAPGNDGTGAVRTMTQKRFTTDETYQVPMSFIDTSTNNTSNVLTGNANFGCTTQNLGIVTGTETYTQCSAPGAPTTTDPLTDSTPTLTGTCTPKTLVSIYDNATTFIASSLCTDGGTYSITTTTLAPGSHSLTARQSNRKGVTSGASVDSAALVREIGCASGLTWNGIACSTACTTTEAPNELKAHVDKPYISCKDTLKGTHFQYRITKPGDVTFTPFISTSIYPVGTRALYDAILPSAEGYTVECIYGNSTMTTPVIDTSCTKTMLVREATAGDDVHGCASISNYYENTLNYETWLSPTAFNATVSCNARMPDPEVANPFLLGYNGVFTGLGYLGVLPGPDGRFSSALNVHTFESGLSTSVTCAVRVGDGYSTNSLCQNIGCGGTGCALPSSYIVKPVDETLFCTKEAEILYNIGCAGSSLGYTGCIGTTGYLYQGLDPVTFTKNLIFRVDGIEQNYTMTCSSATPQTEYDTSISNCTITLPTDKELALRTGEPVSGVTPYQTIYDTVPRDIDAPLAFIIAASDSDTTVISGVGGVQTLVSTDGSWLNRPTPTTIICTNEVEDNDACTCGLFLKEENSIWTFQSPLRDVVPYQHIIMDKEVLINKSYLVIDNAGNVDPEKGKVVINLGVDMTYPSVTGSEVLDPADGDKRIVTLTALDNLDGSGLWGEGIKYVVVDKVGVEPKDIFAPANNTCNLVTTPSYALFPNTGLFSSSPYILPTSYNPLTQKIIYCVQDNAKNQLVGTYPFDPNDLIGCFSDGSQQSLQNLDEIDTTHYYNSLSATGVSALARINALIYGYELTDSTKLTPSTDFRTKLAQNIETYIKQQYCPTTSGFVNMSVDIGEKVTAAAPNLQYAAHIKGNADCPISSVGNNAARNNEGKYYFKGSNGNRMLEFSGVDRLSGSKVVVVEGADIYIRNDIHYVSREDSLVIIVQKDSEGKGGNIYIHPGVTNIDATIIADGALVNGILNEDKTMIPKVWYKDTVGELRNPLTINGRLLTYNTRGGSLYNNWGKLNKRVNDAEGLCASNTIPTPATNTCSDVSMNLPVQNPVLTTLEIAALQDLERFRVITRVTENKRCTLHVTGVMAMNRPEILTQVNL